GLHGGKHHLQPALHRRKPPSRDTRQILWAPRVEYLDGFGALRPLIHRAPDAAHQSAAPPRQCKRRFSRRCWARAAPSRSAEPWHTSTDEELSIPTEEFSFAPSDRPIPSKLRLLLSGSNSQKAANGIPTAVQMNWCKSYRRTEWVAA